MGVVELARAVADPEEMAGGRVPMAARGIDTREGLLIGKQQCLMARVEIRAPEPLRIIRRDTAGPHEVERLRDAARQLIIAAPAGLSATKPRVH